MPVLVAEGAERELPRHVGDLVIVGDLVRRQPVTARHEGRGVRPKPVRPVIASRSGVEDVDGVDIVLVVGGQHRRIETGRHQMVERFADQLSRPLPARRRLVRVIAALVPRPVIGRDDVGIVEPAAGDVQEIVADRTVVAIAGIARLVAEILDLLARDGGGMVGEIDQEGQADERPDRAAARRRELDALGLGEDAQLEPLAVLAAALPPARTLVRQAFHRRRRKAGSGRGRGTQPGFEADPAGIGRARADSRGFEHSAGPRPGIMVEARNRIADHGEAVEGLERRRLLVAGPADLQRGSVGLGEGEFPVDERHRHLSSPRFSRKLRRTG